MSSLRGYQRVPTAAHHSDETLRTEAEEGDAPAGVSAVEATQKVYGKYSRWLLYISLGLASYIYSLDGSTTYNYLSFAASAFGKHTMISSIQVAQSITVAVGKPVVAKVADVSSRGIAYLIVLIFYVIGYIAIASSRGIGSIAVGVVFYAVGFTGLQLLTQIIIADITTLKWRGLISSLSTTPFIINAFLGSLIVDWILGMGGESWRLGYLMFAILVPICLTPLIVTLLWAERRAKKRGVHIKRFSTLSHRVSSPPLSWHGGTYSTITPSRTPSRSPSPSTHRLSRSIPPRPRAHSRTRLTPPRTQLSSIRSSVISIYPDMPLRQKIWRTAEQLDAVGLLLLGLSIGLILLPLTMTKRQDDTKGPWELLLVGLLILFPLFIVWDARFAKRPVVPVRFFGNRSVLAASFIGAFDFASFYLTFMYLYSWVVVVKPWSLRNATYFNQIQTVAMTASGIIAGICMRVFHRYRYILIGGLIVRLSGVMLMLHTRNASSSDVALIFTQVLQGIGGGLAAVASQVGAQASVPHTDVATVTAVILLCAEVGAAGGGAFAGAIWSNNMPQMLRKHLPWLSEEERQELFGSISKAAERPMGDPVRVGVIEAYAEVMYKMVFWATLMSIIPILLAFLMPDWYLGDSQNAVEPDVEVDLEDDSSASESGTSESDIEGEGGAVPRPGGDEAHEGGGNVERVDETRRYDGLPPQ